MRVGRDRASGGRGGGQVVGAGVQQRTLEGAGCTVARGLALGGVRKQKFHLGGGDDSEQCAWRRI